MRSVIRVPANLYLNSFTDLDTITYDLNLIQHSCRLHITYGGMFKKNLKQFIPKHTLWDYITERVTFASCTIIFITSDKTLQIRIKQSNCKTMSYLSYGLSSSYCKLFKVLRLIEHICRTISMICMCRHTLFLIIAPDTSLCL